MVMRQFYEDASEAFPRFAVEASGYEIVDADGRSFIDWMSAGGPVMLGYRNRAVEKAIHDQLSAGPMLSLMHPVELEVASLLTEMIPSAEMVAFGKNGSDVVTGAVRVARATTGKKHILQYGVHGFHDWYVAKFPEVRGIPDELRSLVHPFPYNDLDALVALFDELENDIAAVVMEPVTIEPPQPGFLEGIRELTRERGAVLVFDEMITGFRLANGGAQELYGVIPDLTCLGKAIANGMPLSALVGDRNHMRPLTEVAYGMTFRGETLSLAAARAVLTLLKEGPVAGRLAETGAQVREIFRTACAREHVAADLVGPDARMSFEFYPAGGIAGDRLKRIFLKSCADAGMLTNGNILPTTAHDAAALERTANAVDVGLKAVHGLVEPAGEAVRQAIETGFRAANGALDPGPDGSAPAGFLEILERMAGNLALQGWLLLPDGPPDAVEVVARAGEVHQLERVQRLDLEQGFPNVSNAGHGGFSATLPAESFTANGGYDFAIRARRGDRVVFLSRILSTSDQPARDADRPDWRGDGTLYV
jgi:glutamate-1-semialdehyde 2,1-aminomutase